MANRLRQLKITKSITNRESPSLDKYLTEIGREPMINAQQEVELAERIKDGDEAALEKLVKANLRFVVSVAKQYQNQGLTLPDLINEGNLGLIKAAGRFDATRGFKFISYAVWWIRQQILQTLAEQSRIVRLPLNQVSTLNKINKAFVKLEQTLERTPSFEELGEVMELDPQKIQDTYGLYNRHHTSIDAPFTEGETNTMADVLASDGDASDVILMKKGLIDEVERHLSILTERERAVVKMSFGIGRSEGMTLEEIGSELELTRERVRQIREKAIRRLRHTLRSHKLKAYL